MSTPLPPPFISRIQEQIPDASELLRVLDGPAPVSVRLHPIRAGQTRYLPERPVVPWNEWGRFLPERPAFSRDPLYHSGLYYPMEASSMLLDVALKKATLPEDSLLLDLCAAPGGKSLMIKDRFPDALLVSNEIEGKRAVVLKENAVRWGTEKHLVVQSDAQRLQQSELLFDMILVDAPCSGEGLFRKDPQSRGEWTAERANGCATRQQRILEEALPLLQPEGYLIYSTCTYNPAENMDRVRQLLQSGLEPVVLNMPDDWGVQTISQGEAVGYQCWPHRVRGEGFFLSMLQRPGQRQPGQWPKRAHRGRPCPAGDVFADWQEMLCTEVNDRVVAWDWLEYAVAGRLQGAANLVKQGVVLGTWKGKELIPGYDAAMQWGRTLRLPALELDAEQALQYLGGQALPVKTHKGPVLLTHNGLPLGTGKSNGQRINNLYPKHLRIRI